MGQPKERSEKKNVFVEKYDEITSFDGSEENRSGVKKRLIGKFILKERVRLHHIEIVAMREKDLKYGSLSLCRFNQDVDVMTGYRTRSMMCCPIKAGGRYRLISPPSPPKIIQIF
jgi:hypothetical protein